jgi:cyclic pyranopterin phosphate synthase
MIVIHFNEGGRQMGQVKTKDALNRPLRDLRISVIDRCNFRCQYCMPAEIFHDHFQFLPRNELLTYEEIEKVATIFAELGVEKIRLTGGEPLLRKDLPRLVEKLVKVSGIKDVALTTNGVYLPKYAKELKTAGLKRVNISLDSLDDELFKKINGRGVGTASVLQGIEAAKEAGLGIKINMVVKKGLNEDQILPMAVYCKERDLHLRFIEFMDVGTTNGWKMDHVVSMKEILHILQEKFELEPVDPSYYGEVAKRYIYRDSKTEVGFITSVSQSFCSSCTRARISADGKIYTCLFTGKGHDIKSIVRSDASEEELKAAIAKIWHNRSDRYSDERMVGSSNSREKIEMSYIGG